MLLNIKKLRKKRKSLYEINVLLNIVFLKKYFNKYFTTRRNLNLFFFKKSKKKKITNITIEKFLKLKSPKFLLVNFIKDFFLKTYVKTNKFNFFLNFFFNSISLLKMNSLSFFINYDIINLTNFIKHKIIFINYYFKFSLNKRKYNYVCKLKHASIRYKQTYLTTKKNKLFNCYFIFLKKLKKLFLFKKSYFLDSFIFKKKASTLKKIDSSKQYLLHRTRKLLLFNKKPHCFFLKKFKLKKKKKNLLNNSFNLFFFNKSFKLHKTINNQFNIIPLRRGFFKILLNNRKLIRTVYFLKFKKQKSITNLLLKQIFVPTNQFYLKNEFNIVNLLIRSQFFFFKSDVHFFLKNKHIYVNGIIVDNFNKILSVGDRLQLEVHSNYYFYFRSQKSHSSYFLNKIKHKISRMMRPRNNLYKQQSNYIPN